MHFQKLVILGSPFIGVFCKATDQFVLVPTGIDAKTKRVIAKALEVDAIETRIGNSSLIGALCIANTHGLAVPHITEENEINVLQDAGIRVSRLRTVEALGNHATANDQTGICGNALREETRKHIETTLKIPFTRISIAQSDLIGAASVLTNKGFVCHPNTSETEFERLRTILSLNGNSASANYGDLFIGNSIVANSFGVIAGRHTTGIELMAIDDALR